MDLATAPTSLVVMQETWITLLISTKGWIVQNFPLFLDWCLKYILVPIGYYVINLVHSKFINGNIESTLATTRDIVRATVAKYNQRDIDAIKAANAGKVPPEKVMELRTNTLKDVKAQMNDFTMRTLSIRFPNLDLTLENMIEEEVRNQKVSS